MHPGPINRGVEITSEVADSENSIILNVSDMKHDPDEVQRASLEEILFNWEI